MWPTYQFTVRICLGRVSRRSNTFLYLECYPRDVYHSYNNRYKYFRRRSRDMRCIFAGAFPQFSLKISNRDVGKNIPFIAIDFL